MTKGSRLLAALLVLCTPTVARADEPVRGSADAPVTILVFSAFGCPYCAEAETQLATLRTRYRERLQIVFKHYPLGSDAEAFRLGLCTATKHVIARSLDLIGVDAPDSM